MHPILSNLHDPIALLDDTATITATNDSWELIQPNTTGMNFTEMCEKSAYGTKTKQIRHALQQIKAGNIPVFSIQVDLKKRQFCLQISRLHEPETNTIMISLRNITECITTDNQSADNQKLNELSETNIALNSLLKSREQDRAILEGAIANNVNQLIMPYIERLTDEPLAPQQQTLVTIIKGYLDNLISPFLHRISTLNQQLTPQELKVASLIRQGRSSKEIGEALNLTVNGVGFHRKSIRTKLGLTGSGKNLRSQLMALR